ncbi:MAG: O-sialoglycoprotein endopeptidase [Clostridiales bacterium]|nr:O-sialoglycoprotein endopeptidase [Clostridiales bacterium]
MKYILGFDTSCYTTSIALVDLNGNIVLNSQIPLEVEEGKRGLQQSKALFQHLHRLPLITQQICKVVQPKSDIAAVCATSRPRPVKGSYMPVFMVSHMAGQAFANILEVPYYEVSHQESHIQAGIASAGGPDSLGFMAIHISGGTTELLKVMDNGASYEIDIIGATQDLHAGQFVDRVGVSMGLRFPAGSQLEELALKGEANVVTIPSSVKDLTVSFSGAETCAQRLMKQGIRKEDIATAVYNCIIKTLEKWILNAIKVYQLKDILLVGGVASSRILRHELIKRLSQRDSDIKLYFADPVLSRDNAVGTALLGLKIYKHDAV